MKVIGKTMKNGTLIDITVHVGDDEKSQKAYRATMKGVTCPKCGAAVVPDPKDMNIIITEPLTGKFGLDTAKVSTNCPNCGHHIVTVDEYEVTPFTDIPQFLRKLRFEYQQRGIQARLQNNGQA